MVSGERHVPGERTVEKEHESPRVVGVPMALVAGISVSFIFVVSMFPQLIMGAIFGRAFATTSSLLSLYAVATAIYAIAMVLMAYDLSPHRQCRVAAVVVQWSAWWW